MKLLVISYTVRVHCARSYREWNPNEIIQEIEKDIPQTLVIAEDDPRFIELTQEGLPPICKEDLFDVVSDDAATHGYSCWYNLFFEDDECIGDIMTKTVRDPNVTSFKIIEVGGLL